MEIIIATLVMALSGLFYLERKRYNENNSLKRELKEIRIALETKEGYTKNVLNNYRLQYSVCFDYLVSTCNKLASANNKVKSKIKFSDMAELYDFVKLNRPEISSPDQEVEKFLQYFKIKQRKNAKKD